MASSRLGSASAGTGGLGGGVGGRLGSRVGGASAGTGGTTVLHGGLASAGDSGLLAPITEERPPDGGGYVCSPAPGMPPGSESRLDLLRPVQRTGHRFNPDELLHEFHAHARFDDAVACPPKLLERAGLVGSGHPSVAGMFRAVYLQRALAERIRTHSRGEQSRHSHFRACSSLRDVAIDTHDSILSALAPVPQMRIAALIRLGRASTADCRTPPTTPWQRGATPSRPASILPSSRPIGAVWRTFAALLSRRRFRAARPACPGVRAAPERCVDGVGRGGACVAVRFGERVSRMTTSNPRGTLENRPTRDRRDRFIYAIQDLFRQVCLHVFACQGLVSKQQLQSSESARTYANILPSAGRRPEKSAKALPAADERRLTRINESCSLLIIGVHLRLSAASIGSVISWQALSSIL